MKNKAQKRSEAKRRFLTLELDLKRWHLHYQINSQKKNSLGQVMESWWDIQMSYLGSENWMRLVLQGGWIPRVLEKNITFRVSLSLISVVDNVRLQYSSPKSAFLYWSLNCSVSPNAVFISRTRWSTDAGIPDVNVSFLASSSPKMILKWTGLDIFHLGYSGEEKQDSSS